MSTLEQEKIIETLPSGWKIKRVKEIAKWQTGFTPDTKKSEYYNGNDDWITIGDMDGKYIKASKNKINGNMFPKNWITPCNSLLFSFKLSIGQVAFNEKDVFTNEAICSFWPQSEIDLKYFYYAAPIFIVRNAKKNIYGADLLNQELISDALVLTPPKEKQIAIANYLDNETSKIDRKISILEKKVEKLEEYKKSIIFETVTKGLDSTVQMKDSGIDWIGDIPAHWQVKRVKEFYKLGMGQTILKEDLVDKGTYPVYSATAEDKFFGYVNKINNPLNIGDLVIPARGNSIGHIKLVKETVACTQTTIYMKKKSNINSNFVYYYLIGNKPQLFFFDDTAIPQITVEQINGRLMLIPNLQEQKQIVYYINKECSKIDKHLAIIKKQIGLLKEYKQTVIYEAVTGKIIIGEK